MKLYDEMRDKFGFKDGEDVPSFAGPLRTLYVCAINTFARVEKSQYRAVEYNRTGLHNWCMIQYVTVKDFRRKERDIVDSTKVDEAMHRAVFHAFRFNVDRFVVLTAEADILSFNDNIRKAVDELKQDKFRTNKKGKRL
jgi:hypothetical protein